METATISTSLPVRLQRLQTLIRKMPLLELRRIFRAGDVSPPAKKEDIIECLLELTDIADTEFNADTIAASDYFQLWAKCWTSFLPVDGDLSDLQDRVLEHVGITPSPPEDEDITRARDYLASRNLSTTGDLDVMLERRRLYNKGEYRTDFDDMEPSVLHLHLEMFHLTPTGDPAQDIALVTAAVRERKRTGQSPNTTPSKRKLDTAQPLLSPDQPPAKAVRSDEVISSTGPIGFGFAPALTSQPAGSPSLHELQQSMHTLVQTVHAHIQGVAQSAPALEQRVGSLHDELRALAQTVGEQVHCLSQRVNAPTSSSDQVDVKTIVQAYSDNASAVTNAVRELADTCRDALTQRAGTGLGDNDTRPLASAKDGKDLRRHLANTQPHDIRPEYLACPETLGLQCERMFAYIDEHAEDPGDVSLYLRIKDEKVVVLNLFAQERHYEGERRFLQLAHKILLWAGKFEAKTGIDDAVSTRTLQARLFDAAFEKMQGDICRYTEQIADGEAFYRYQISIMVRASLGVSVSLQTLKSMKKTEDLRRSIFKQFGGEGQVPSQSSSDFGPQPERLPPTPVTVPAISTTARQKEQRPTGDSEAKFSRKCGIGMPMSKGIIGASTEGAKDSTSTCSKCSNPDIPHQAYECPVLFAETYASQGLVMPGFDARCQRVPDAWEGEDITTNTRIAWRTLQAKGFFTCSPWTRSKQPGPKF